ncbi:hypothetical protein AAC387_Pa10g0705 [Persea americana]
MKKRQSQAYISQIIDADNIVYTDSSRIAAVFVSHSQQILGSDIQNQYPDLSHITPYGVLTDGDALDLMHPITFAEIEDVVKSANNPNKAPGLDNKNDTLIIAKILFNAYVWAEHNARIFRNVTLPYGSVVLRIIQIVTTKIFFLDLILPNDIQCHWNVPVHTPVMVAKSG